jgi:hypothetical protein
VIGEPLLASPAVVPAAELTAVRARGGLEIDLLPRVLAHIADEEIPGQAVERDAPRVAEAVRPDLPARGRHSRARDRHCRRAEERIGEWDRIVWWARDINVQAENLAEKLAEVLGVVRRVIAAPAVSDACVEVAVGSKDQRAAVVVRLSGVGDGQEDLGRGGIGDVRVAGHGVPRDDLIPPRVGVVDEEQAVACIVRVEGEAQEPPLAVRVDEPRDVEKRPRGDSVEDADLAPLEDDEQPRVAGVRNRHRFRDARQAGHRLEADSEVGGSSWRCEEAEAPGTQTQPNEPATD